MQNLGSNKVTADGAAIYLAQNYLMHFIRYTKEDYIANWHHELMCEYLDAFVNKEIKNLMIFAPPQHGKSEVVSRRLPAYILGRSPNTRVVGASYSAELSSRFNRDVQRIIDDEKYMSIFHDTTLNSKNVRTSAKGNYVRNVDMFEIVGHEGSYKSVGVGNPLTGSPADIGIIDDPVKDTIDATSPVMQKRNWNWYNDVFLTRLHNDSQILLTQTRWDKSDLSGMVLKMIAAGKEDKWEILTLEAVKDKIVHPKDPRKIGDALWPERHSLEKSLKAKERSPRTFAALYQQDPQPPKSSLVYPNYKIVDEIPECQKNMIGMDWGFMTSKTAAVNIHFNYDSIYIDELMYGNKMMNSEIAEKMSNYKQDVIIADSNELKTILEFQGWGFNMIGVKKPPNSVQIGIEMVNRFDIYVTSRSVNVINEFKNYRYKEDVEGNPTGEPIKNHDHAMDALRYVVYSHFENQGENFYKERNYEW